MALADTSAVDVLWIVLSVFLAIVGIFLCFALVRAGGALGRLSRLLESAEESVVPLAEKVGGTVDRVNVQLDKVDLVTDSAVSAADSADTAVRAVSKAVTTPVQKVSSLAAGMSHGASAFMAGHDVKTSVDAGRDAARRRSEQIAEELGRRDRRLAAAGGRRPGQPSRAAHDLASPPAQDVPWQAPQTPAGRPPEGRGASGDLAEAGPGPGAADTAA